MIDRGKILIICILLAAVATAGFAVWYRQQHVRRVIAAFSPQVAELIANASAAELWRLEPAADGESQLDDRIRIQGVAYQIVARKAATGKKAFATLRGWLVHDDNYDWNPAASDRTGRWQHAVQLKEGEERVVLAFNLIDEQLILVGQGTILSTAPMAEGLKAFFERQFPSRL